MGRNMGWATSLAVRLLQSPMVQEALFVPYFMYYMVTVSG